MLGVIALLGAVGALQGVAESLAAPQMAGQVVANAGALQGGAVRLLAILLAGGAIIWAMAAGRLKGGVATALLVLVTVADLWSVDRLFFEWNRPAKEIFADDALITRMRQTAPPVPGHERAGCPGRVPGIDADGARRPAGVRVSRKRGALLR